MITPQDIREKAFERAVRGYDMAAVDDFLDELAADYTNMAKENASLKSKMRVLVEKIEEYRQTEDSMRLALLSAQKMGAQMEADAQAKADAILKEANDAADAITRETRAEIENEQAKLAEAKKATKKYVDHMTAVCQKQMEFYGKLAEARLVSSPAAAAVEAEEAEAVRSIESSVEQAVMQEPEEPITLQDESALMPDEDDSPACLRQSRCAKRPGPGMTIVSTRTMTENGEPYYG